jgi:hypothetical protein
VFTLEGTGNIVNYLQIRISIESNKIELGWHRKDQAKDSFLHFHSNTPLPSKKANVINLLKFFNTLQNFNSDINNKTGVHRESNQDELRKILILNSYPTNLINNWFSECTKVIRDEESTKNAYSNFNRLCAATASARVNVPSDGHCLIHSVCQASSKQYGSVIATLDNYLEANSLKFKAILPACWKRQLRDYVEKKVWNQDLAYILPAILSDVIGRSINVITDYATKIKVSAFEHVPCSTDNEIFLILQNGHYNWLNMEKLEPNTLSWLKGSTCTREPDSKPNFARPTIVLPFKSDVASNKINRFKESLSIGNEFNISFKTTGKLCEIARRTNAKLVNQKCDEIKQHKPDVGVVYSLKCKDCHEDGITSVYIRETGRELDIRLKEQCKYIRDECIGKTSCSAVGNMRGSNMANSLYSADGT